MLAARILINKPVPSASAHSQRQSDEYQHEGGDDFVETAPNAHPLRNLIATAHPQRSPAKEIVIRYADDSETRYRHHSSCACSTARMARNNQSHPPRRSTSHSHKTASLRIINHIFIARKKNKATPSQPIVGRFELSILALENHLSKAKCEHIEFKDCYSMPRSDPDSISSIRTRTAR
jgi:hypothetical protein